MQADEVAGTAAYEPARNPQVLVPHEATWPSHCDIRMWFNGGRFLCDVCGQRRPPEPEEVEQRPHATPRMQPAEIIARALQAYEDEIVQATPDRLWDDLQPRERQGYSDRAQAALDALRDHRCAVVDATPHGEACRD